MQKNFENPLDKPKKVCYNTPHHRNAMKELFFAYSAFRESAGGASRYTEQSKSHSRAEPLNVSVSVSGLSRYKTKELMGSER